MRNPNKAKPVAWRHRLLNISGVMSGWILTEEKPTNKWSSGKPIEGFEMEPLFLSANAEINCTSKQTQLN